MRSFFKIGLISIGLVLIFIGVLGMLVLTQAQGLLTGSVEALLTETFGSSATVKRVSLNPSTGAIMVYDFALANPMGFKPGDAFTARRIDVSLTPKSLFSRAKVIKKMDIVGGSIRLRYELGRGTNLGTLATLLAEKPAAETRTFQVRELTCQDAKLHISTNILPTPGMSMNVVTVRLENLENGRPITGAQMTSTFLRSVLMEVLTVKGLLSSVAEKMRGEARGDS